MGLFDRLRSKKEDPRLSCLWDDPGDIAVVTTQEIIDGKRPVVLVIHDEGIGGWQFLDADPLEGRDPVAIAKQDMLDLDPTLSEVTDLPAGWYAQREAPGTSWCRASSTAELGADAALSSDADKFLAEAGAEYEGKQQTLEQGEWRLASCAEWNFDDDTGVVTVSFEDGSQWQADGQFLGTFNPEDKTFQWAWDNPDICEHLTRDSRLVKAVGERFGLEYLLMGDGCFSIPGPEFVAYLCGIALKATDSMGVMEADAEGMVGFILLKNPRWTHAVRPDAA